MGYDVMTGTLCRYKRGVVITEQCNVTVDGETLIGTTEYLTLYTGCFINRYRYNRVRLYSDTSANEDNSFRNHIR